MSNAKNPATNGRVVQLRHAAPLGAMLHAWRTERVRVEGGGAALFPNVTAAQYRTALQDAATAAGIAPDKAGRVFLPQGLRYGAAADYLLSDKSVTAADVQQWAPWATPDTLRYYADHSMADSIREHNAVPKEQREQAAMWRDEPDTFATWFIYCMQTRGRGRA